MPIIPILDNARIHRARLTKEVSGRLGIIRTFLPPYSPDLNPIEFCWKDVKRELSGILEFDRAVQEAKPTAIKLFRERKVNYTSYWSEKFINDRG